VLPDSHGCLISDDEGCIFFACHKRQLNLCCSPRGHRRPLSRLPRIGHARHGRYFEGIRQTLDAILEIGADEEEVDNETYERETAELL